MRTHAHAHAYARTHARTRTHARPHTRTYTRIHARTYTHTRDDRRESEGAGCYPKNPLHNLLPVTLCGNTVTLFGNTVTLSSTVYLPSNSSKSLILLALRKLAWCLHCITRQRNTHKPKGKRNAKTTHATFPNRRTSKRARSKRLRDTLLARHA